MTSEAELRVGLVEISRAENQLAFIVPFETGAGNDDENTVCPVPKFCSVTSTVDFHIVDVFRINLWAEV